MCEAERLYLIGNGFDISHGINSRYSDYKAWLNKNNEPLLEDIIKAYGCEGEWWNEFEEQLGKLNIELFSNKCKGYGCAEYLDNCKIMRTNYPDIPPAFHYSPVGRKMKEMSEEIRQSFNHWVSSLEKDISKVKPISIWSIQPTNSLFFTFNYTNTLEMVYGIDTKSILYIHEKANTGKPLIFGHDKSAGSLSFEIDENSLHITQNDYTEVPLWLGSLMKNVDYNITVHSDFFKKLIGITNIYVYGFSFGGVDMPYITEIYKKTNYNNPLWTISSHSELDTQRIERFKDSYGIQNERVIIYKTY